jgi:hypothetical protein
MHLADLHHPRLVAISLRSIPGKYQIQQVALPAKALYMLLVAGGNWSSMVPSWKEEWRAGMSGMEERQLPLQTVG